MKQVYDSWLEIPASHGRELAHAMVPTGPLLQFISAHDAPSHGHGRLF